MSVTRDFKAQREAICLRDPDGNAIILVGNPGETREGNMTTTSLSTIDPFCSEFLANPYPFHL